MPEPSRTLRANALLLLPHRQLSSLPTQTPFWDPFRACDTSGVFHFFFIQEAVRCIGRTSFFPPESGQDRQSAYETPAESFYQRRQEERWTVLWVCGFGEENQSPAASDKKRIPGQPHKGRGGAVSSLASAH